MSTSRGKNTRAPTRESTAARESPATSWTLRRSPYWERVQQPGAGREASQATVSLRCQAERVELRISDDGRGFDLKSIPTESLGMGIMRERAQAVGITLTVESEIGHGAEVVAVWSKE